MQENNEDLLLVERAQSGDHAAFKELYEKYEKRILNYLWRMLNNRSLAEEVLQKTLIRAYLKLHHFKGYGSFSSWLYAIARNVAKNEIKNIKKVKKVSLSAKVTEDGNVTMADMLKSEATEIETLLEKEEIRKKFEAVFNNLPAHYREIITLCVIQKISYDEVAKMLNCSRDAVASRLLRAKRYFVKRMKEMSEEER